MQKVQANVNASNFLLVGIQTGMSKEVSESSSLGFADIFADVNSKDVTETQDNTVKVDDKKEMIDSSQEHASDNMKKETVISKNNTTDDVKNETLISEEQPVENEEVSEAPDMDLSEEDEKIVLETIGAVLEMLMKQFGLSEQELEEKLKTFGMEIEDLFSQEGQKEFFLNMKGADISDLIVNEELNQELKTFMNQFQDLLSENNFTEKQIAEVLKEVDTEELLTEIPVDKEWNVEKDKEIAADNQMPDAISETEEPEVIVENQMKQNNSSNRKQSESKAEVPIEREAGLKTETDSVKQTQFESPILQAINEALNQVEDVAMTEQQIYGRDVIEQIVNQIRINLNQDTTSLEMQLYPEHLGKIQINVVSKDGIMTAKIVAETEAAKQAIEHGLFNLKESMQQQNLKVDAIEVMVATTGFEKGNEEQNAFEDKNTSKGNGKHLDLSDPEEEEETDAETERMKIIGSSVSFSA